MLLQERIDGTSIHLYRDILSNLVSECGFLIDRGAISAFQRNYFKAPSGRIVDTRDYGTTSQKLSCTANDNSVVQVFS